MDGDADRERIAIQRKDAGIGRETHADGRGDHQRLQNAAGAGDALHGLDDLAEGNGDALIVELSPGCERIGREGTASPSGIGDIVIGLLDAGAGEVGLGGRGIRRDGGFDDWVGVRVTISKLDWSGLPVTALAFEPDAGQLGFAGGVAGVNVDLDGRAGRDGAGRLVRSAAEGAVVVVVGFSGCGEGLQIEAESISKRGLELLQLEV